MTPKEFLFASRSFDNLLRNGPGPIPDGTAAAFAKALEEVPPDPPKRACDCKFSDAWRCAREKNLYRQIACRCECHRYLERQK